MKIYPTMDPDHPTPLKPAGLIAQEDLGGMRTAYINDADIRNAPNVTAFRRGIYILIMLRAGRLFEQLDKVGDSRQLYEIAELGTSPNETIKAPEHMLLKMPEGQRRVEGDGLDLDIFTVHLKPRDRTPGSMDSTISSRQRPPKRLQGLSK